MAADVGTVAAPDELGDCCWDDGGGLDLGALGVAGVVAVAVGAGVRGGGVLDVRGGVGEGECGVRRGRGDGRDGAVRAGCVVDPEAGDAEEPVSGRTTR